MILSGTNTYSGLTDVQGGQLSVRGILSNSAVQVESGATLGGTGAINGTVTVLKRRYPLPGQHRCRHSDGRFAGVELRIAVRLYLGTPGVVGGVNDLVAVTGNLTLAGSLNITDAGGFGIGVYRLFNYGGTLSNNVMTIGTVPNGVTPGALTIQTSVANQVNLVVSGSSLLEFWDGPNVVENGTVSGGTGPGTTPRPTGLWRTGAATRPGNRVLRCLKARPER